MNFHRTTDHVREENDHRARPPPRVCALTRSTACTHEESPGGLARDRDGRSHSWEWIRPSALAERAPRLTAIDDRDRRGADSLQTPSAIVVCKVRQESRDDHCSLAHPGRMHARPSDSDARRQAHLRSLSVFSAHQAPRLCDELLFSFPRHVLLPIRQGAARDEEAHMEASRINAQLL
jgi:hypothetical protein